MVLVIMMPPAAYVDLTARPLKPAGRGRACLSLRLSLREFPGPRFLLAVATIAILLLLPSVASAQPALPHVILGSATINGSPAPDGMVVAALVDGRQVAAEPISGGDGAFGVLLVEPENGSFDGKIITFTIGGFAAAESVFWLVGGGTEIALSASPAQGTPTPTPRATAAPFPTPVILAGEQGEPGQRGSQGSQGSQGLQGVQGPSGPPGVGGPPGSAGAAGPAGVAGPTGSQGLTGPEGDLGDSGSSLFGILAFVFALFAVLGTFGGMLWRRLVE